MGVAARSRPGQGTPQGRRARGRPNRESSSARARSCASARRAPSSQSTSIPTGAISIDFALGVGGVPRGRVVEIFGPESSGKTTLALQVIAEAQKLGGMAAFVDAEHALDADVCAEAGRRRRQPARLAARQRRAGARDRRSPDSLERRRRRRRRLGGRVGAESRNRRRDGRSADGAAGAAHVAGAPQAHRRRLEVEDMPDLHQPAPREDRRHVRQPGNDDRRPRAEVLLRRSGWTSAASPASRTATSSSAAARA